MSAYNATTVVERENLFISVDSKKISDPLETLDFSFLGSDMKITTARCDDSSQLFLNAVTGMAINLGRPSGGQNFNSIGSLTICLHSLLSALQSPIVGLAAAEAQRENWQHAWNCVRDCNQFILPRSERYAVCMPFSHLSSSFCPLVTTISVSSLTQSDCSTTMSDFFFVFSSTCHFISWPVNLKSFTSSCPILKFALTFFLNFTRNSGEPGVNKSSTCKQHIPMVFL